MLVSVPSILKIGKDERLAGSLELTERGLELLLGELPHFGEEQHDKEVALPNGLVVLVLQPGLGDGVEKILPHDELEENAFIDPVLVLAIDEDLEFLAVVAQLGGGSEKQLFPDHPG